MRLFLAIAAVSVLAAPTLADDLKGGEADARANPPVGHFLDEYRFGGTYRTIATADATSCAALCSGDAYCRAWSYTAPGAGITARCELKQVVGSAEYRPGTTSGLSRLVMDRLVLAVREPEPDTIKTAEVPRPERAASAHQALPVGSAPRVRVGNYVMAQAEAHASSLDKPVRTTPNASLTRHLAAGQPLQLKDPTARSLTRQTPGFSREIVFDGDPDLVGRVYGTYTKLP